MLPTLVMFDIDGTLTESTDLDSAAYLDALREEFHFRDVSGDWASYPHATDSGVLAAVFRARLGRTPTSDEISRMQRRYVSLLNERIASVGELHPILGAPKVLASLADDPLYAISVASGAWRLAAELKLRAAGLPVDRFPAAFSDDDPSREGICQLSRRRAEISYGQVFQRVIYVGDGVWDVRTSRKLGYEFVGIGQDTNARKLLRDVGATQIFPNFRDTEAFLVCLRQPASGGG